MKIVWMLTVMAAHGPVTADVLTMEGFADRAACSAFAEATLPSAQALVDSGTMFGPVLRLDSPAMRWDDPNFGLAEFHVEFRCEPVAD